MLLKCGIEVSSAKTELNWLQKCAMAMWEVAQDKISVLLFTSWYRKSYNLISQLNSQNVVYFVYI